MVMNAHAVFVDDADPSFLFTMPRRKTDDGVKAENAMNVRLSAQGVARPELRLLWLAPCLVKFYRFDHFIWTKRYDLNLDNEPDESQKSDLVGDGQIIWSFARVEDDNGQRVIWEQTQTKKEQTVREYSYLKAKKMWQDRGANLLWIMRPQSRFNSDEISQSLTNKLAKSMTEWLEAMDRLRLPRA
jgi:hypothetical protein